MEIKFPKGGIFLIVIVVIGIIFISKATITINGGERGVLYETLGDGIVTDRPALDEGFQFILPWNRVQRFNVRQQEFFDQMKVLSSNGLDIQLDATIWYQPLQEKLGNLHKEKGVNYLETIVRPALRSATREVVGRYTPEEIYSSKRAIIQKEIFEETKLILDSQYVQINQVLVRDVTLPQTIRDAIERKLRQEQEALEYEFRLIKAKKEAEKQIIEAEGKAKSNRILSASLTDKILQDKGIEATLKLSESPNSKVIVIGSGKSGMPIILGNQ
ncbi:MAG: prohibitin family protein [Polaribacter sp.]|nr:prohibitin family protein [Polaribacter sp.]